MTTPQQMMERVTRIHRAMEEGADRTVEDDVMRQLTGDISEYLIGTFGLEAALQLYPLLMPFAMACASVGFIAAEENWAEEWMQP